MGRALELSFARGPIGYRYRSDVSYREARRLLISDLSADPCLTKLIRSAERFLPKSLAQCAHIPPTWWTNPSTGGRVQLIGLQDRILVALDKAGRIPATVEVRPAVPEPNSPAPTNCAGKANRAQRRAAERKQHARQLSADNRPIKEIAGILKCSQRTVSTYLRDD